MNINGYENLKDLTQGIADNTQGELSTYLGNNVNSPIDDGLGMYNRAVNDLFTYGDHRVSMNEGVEYAYDIKPIYDNLDKITAVLRAQLKRINAREMEANKDFKSDPRIGSALGFIDDENGEFQALKDAMDDAKHPPSLSTDIKIKDKTKFLNVLKQIFKDLPSDQLQHLISSASGFISTFDIESVREFISKIETQAEEGKFYNGDINKQERDTTLNKLVGGMMTYILRNFDDTEMDSGIESIINYSIDQRLPKLANSIRDNEWIELPMDEQSTKPNIGSLSTISIEEVRNAILNEFNTGNADYNVLRKLYLNEELPENEKPSFERSVQ